MQDQPNTTKEPRAAGKTAEKGEDRMFCTECGTKNTADANFCKKCGHKMDKHPAPPISEEDMVRLAPTDEKLSRMMVLAFERNEAGDVDGAISDCREALEFAPDSTSAHSLMGMLYEKKGDREKAIAEFEKVLELNPGSIA